MRPVTIPLGIRGRMSWSVQDERGAPTLVLARYADGRERRLWGGFWSPNLITNVGMDAFHDTGDGWIGLNSQATGSVRRWARIGTGSTAPAFTDTALDNQVQTSSASTPFNANGFSATEGTDEITLHCVARRTFVMGVDRNLTEYGFSTTEAGSLNVRELFRDEHGSPVTISVLAGKTLRIDHSFDIVLDLSVWQGSFDIEEYDAANTFVGATTLDYDARWWSGRSASGTPAENGRSFGVGAELLADGTDYAGVTGALVYTTNANPDITASPFLGNVGSAPEGYTIMSSLAGGAEAAVFSRRAYASGTHERVWDATIQAAYGNWAWTGWGTRRQATYDTPDTAIGGVIVAFRNDGSFTKADTHELRWSLKYAWARA